MVTSLKQNFLQHEPRAELEGGGAEEEIASTATAASSGMLGSPAGDAPLALPAPAAAASADATIADPLLELERLEVQASTDMRGAAAASAEAEEKATKQAERKRRKKLPRRRRRACPPPPPPRAKRGKKRPRAAMGLSLIHISEPTRLALI
eukprot:12682208-Alexandrium_andersonii.AAC.1